MSINFDSFSNTVLNLQTILEKRGVKIKAFSDRPYFKLLPIERQNYIIEKLQAEVEQITLFKEELSEIDKLSLICEYHNLYLKDHSAGAMLKSDEPWEIMDFNLNQLFRNRKVFEIGNYSLEDYETYSPWELFSRPQLVLQELALAMEKIKKEQKIIFLDYIKPYFMQENYTDKQEKGLVSHKFIIPLFDCETHECVAFISSLQIQKYDLNVQSKISILNN